MKNYFIIKYIITKSREYIFIFLTATIFLFISFSKSFSEENVFILDNIEVKGIIDINFSRDKYINRAFLDSFEILISKILVSASTLQEILLQVLNRILFYVLDIIIFKIFLRDFV